VVRYYIEIFAGPAEPGRQALLDSLAGEVRGLGIHRAVELVAAAPPADEPNIGVYFGNPLLAQDAETTERVAAALAAGRPVVPVVGNLTEFPACVPGCLRLVNGVEWTAASPDTGLAQTVLMGLGITERQRRVFISHKREDGMAAAGQLHEALSRHGFFPFIDRFHIAPGRNVKEEIANQLDDCALLLLVETPLAHDSPWVLDEVDHALTRNLGAHIVTWPGVSEQIPGTSGLARQRLAPGDIVPHRGFDTLTDSALEEVVISVEAEHARALVRRRRYLITSLEDAAREAGLDCVPIPGWGTVVSGPEGPSIVQVTPRMPTVEDLYELDITRSKFPGGPSGVLVHAPRRVPASRREVLAWAGASRDLTLVPENAIGGYWRRSDVR
jgi:TIR domain